MEMQLLNYVNVDMNWTVIRKGRTAMTRCPRKPLPFEPSHKLYELAGVERNKKRKLAHRSISPGPQTPSVRYEGSGQRIRSNSVSQSLKRKSKTRLRNNKMLKRMNNKVLGVDDFSGIELLATVACSGFVNVEEFSVLKEHTTPPKFDTCDSDVKGAQSNGLSVKQNIKDIGKDFDEKKVAGSKELRLHWDLNTVMDEWKEPCDDLLIEPRLSVKHDASFSVAPLSENCVKEDLKVTNTENISMKTSDGESFESKSDVVNDLLTHPVKCEDLSSSTTSVLMEQAVVNFKAERIDDPLVHSHSKVVECKSDQHPVSKEAVQGFCNGNTATDHVSECCGSNVTQEEQGHMGGYDSPFEDGELRELVEKTEKDTVHESSDKVYKDDPGNIEDPLSKNVNHGHTTGDQTSLSVKESVSNDEVKQEVQVDSFERPNSDKSRKYLYEKKNGHDVDLSLVGGNLLQKSIDGSRNGEYVQRNRFSTSGDFSRVWDLKSHKGLDSNYSRNYNSRGGGGGGGYRTYDRRPSPSERNDSYSNYRGPPPARSHSRDRYRFHTQEYRDPKPCYFERRQRFSSNFNQHGMRSRPRSRSRSRSPIAWHFQKRKNFETSNSVEDETASRSGHAHVSPERPSKCFDDRRFRDGQFRDNRHSSFTINKQRFDPLGYPERLKSDDYYRRPARFEQMTGYKYKDKQ